MHVIVYPKAFGNQQQASDGPYGRISVWSAVVPPPPPLAVEGGGVTWQQSSLGFGGGTAVPWGMGGVGGWTRGQGVLELSVVSCA